MPELKTLQEKVAGSFHVFAGFAPVVSLPETVRALLLASYPEIDNGESGYVEMVGF